MFTRTRGGCLNAAMEPSLVLTLFATVTTTAMSVRRASTLWPHSATVPTHVEKNRAKAAVNTGLPKPSAKPAHLK